MFHFCLRDFVHTILYLFANKIIVKMSPKFHLWFTVWLLQRSCDKKCSPCLAPMVKFPNQLFFSQLPFLESFSCAPRISFVFRADNFYSILDFCFVFLCAVRRTCKLYSNSSWQLFEFENPFELSFKSKKTFLT